MLVAPLQAGAQGPAVTGDEEPAPERSKRPAQLEPSPAASEMAEAPLEPAPEPEPDLAADSVEPAALPADAAEAPPVGGRTSLDRGLELALELDSNLARIPSTSDEPTEAVSVLRLGGRAGMDVGGPAVTCCMSRAR